MRIFSWAVIWLTPNVDSVRADVLCVFLAVAAINTLESYLISNTEDTSEPEVAVLALYRTQTHTEMCKFAIIVGVASISFHFAISFRISIY